MSLQKTLPLLKRNAAIFQRFVWSQTRTVKTEASKSEPSDEPIKFSTSKAAQWKAKYSTSGEEYFQTPKIQAPVVLFSLVSFMIYFCILREENDLDDWIKDLEKRGPLQLEEAQLRAQIEHFRKTGKDTKFLEQRMADVQKIQKQIHSLNV